jgi:hypothetical protein
MGKLLLESLILCAQQCLLLELMGVRWLLAIAGTKRQTTDSLRLGENGGSGMGHIGYLKFILKHDMF